MATCIHGNLYRAIWDKHHFIYSRNCPNECPFFEKKNKGHAVQRWKHIVRRNKQVEEEKENNND